MKERTIKRFLWSIGTACASAMLGYIVYPSVWGLGIAMILIAHEWGHWMAAKKVNANPEFPVFVPLGLVTLGWTNVNNVTKETRRFIAAAGPLMGIFAAMTLGVVALVTGNVALWWIAMLAGIFEIYSGTLGRDGRRKKSIA